MTTIIHPLQVEHWAVPGEPVPFSEAVQQEYAPTPTNATWGRAWSSTWFRLSGRVPEGADRRRLEIVCDLGFTADRPGFQVEGLAYRPDGSVLKAVSPRSHHLPVEDGTDAVEIYIEAAANPDIAGEWTFAATPLGDAATAGADPLYRLGTVAFVRRDETAWELLQDLRLLSGLLRELPRDSPRHHLIVRGVERMLDVADPDDIAGTAASAREAIAALMSSPAHASSHRIVAVGHAHIDSAWLWPTRETIRKVARTFANVLELMERDPALVFAASSAQQYAWLEEHHPALFDRVRAQVAAGRFIPVGGMWVESDTNMPSGESLIRQFLHGKRFFRERFGVEAEEVWLPDSFGYSAALPQIVRGTGNRWFLTQKLSWSQVNRLPHHTFWWEGIDGTRVFTHLPPADSYNSELTPQELLHTEHNFSDAGAATMSLVPFGFGDGGGGPTREMLAAAKRSRDLEGLPRVELGTPAEFFRAAEAEYPDAPLWAGEMYLELHRGTYTSQVRTKQGNRRSEQLLHEAELWSATAAVRTGAPYPYAALRAAWENVLLLQFHDILPGSSIAWVHREAERDYARIREELTSIIERGIAALVGTGSSELLANATPLVERGVAAFAVDAPSIPAAVATWQRRTDGAILLDNAELRVVIDTRGRIVSLIDRRSNREAVAPGGAANRLVLHRDTPVEWDAWDIDAHYRRVTTPLDEDAPDAMHVVTADDGTVTVVVERSFGASGLTQRLSLAPDAPAVDIEIAVDWHESQKLLRLLIDVDVHTEATTAETQFGHVSRATHENTSWDAARFEFCAHRWVHVGEPGYGVCVANDSTHGHDARRIHRSGGGRTTTLGLSLLRAPRFPDPVADLGTHSLRVSVRPNASVIDAVAEGYRLNRPSRSVRGEHPAAPLFDLRSGTVIAETVKLAEDESGDVILRLYESAGGRGTITVTPLFDVERCERADLLERPTEQMDMAELDGFELRAFEIVTLRYRPRRVG